MVRPAFILLGYRGVLSASATVSPERSESAVRCDATDPREAKLHEAINTEPPLGNITLIPFLADDARDPALGSLLRFFTVVNDPTWLLLLSQKSQEKAGSACVLYVKLFHIPVVGESLRLHRALNSLILHHFGAPGGTSMCKFLMSVEELFATARAYADSVAEAPARNSLVSLHLSQEEVSSLAEKMLSSSSVSAGKIQEAELEEIPNSTVNLQRETLAHELRLEAVSGGDGHRAALKKEAEEHRREVRQELAFVRARRQALLREGSELVVRMREEERRRKGHAVGRAEGSVGRRRNWLRCRGSTTSVSRRAYACWRHSEGEDWRSPRTRRRGRWLWPPFRWRRMCFRRSSSRGTTSWQGRPTRKRK
ncbi:uncharacterized protein Tco025E_06981 [Trypanosoma conorhini]|uniref:Uncharacterized protein n=1 Tax=Trypanosoma conorhini TaxID=83891 RepID=A0A3S5IRZ8_9TRYP|nr:uncharacterized protein Tco025E_06981 [Trypanosoma conorhini]RNF09428.1 hypothetical protein Tco025E_06981 [Trypanosoma conorhini]